MLPFCAKTIVKESREFELARRRIRRRRRRRRRRRKKEKHFGRLVTFWFGNFAILAPLGVFFVMKTLEDER